MFVEWDEVELRNGNPTIKTKEGAYMRWSILELQVYDLFRTVNNHNHNQILLDDIHFF